MVISDTRYRYKVIFTDELFLLFRADGNVAAEKHAVFLGRIRRRKVHRIIWLGD